MRDRAGEERDCEKENRVDKGTGGGHSELPAGFNTRNSNGPPH